LFAKLLIASIFQLFQLTWFPEGWTIRLSRAVSRVIIPFSPAVFKAAEARGTNMIALAWIVGIAGCELLALGSPREMTYP
jgi:hypothetical protein